MSRLGRWTAVALASVFVAGGAAGARASTSPGDVSLLHIDVVASPKRAQRIRNRLARPRPLPRSLVRGVDATLVVVAAAGETEPNHFATSVVVINRGTSGSSSSALEERIARAALRRLTGIPLGPREIAPAYDVLTSAPAATFCGALAPDLVARLTSPVLLLAQLAFTPWTPGQLVRNAIGLAFLACGLPVPAALSPDDVERLSEAIRTPGTGTTTTTLPEEQCDGRTRLEAKTLVDPPYPDCTDVEWITPIPDCADDLSVDVIDAGSEQPIDALLFGHTTHVTYFFGLNPVRLILRACNGDPASPGGASVTLAAIVGWGG